MQWFQLHDADLTGCTRSHDSSYTRVNIYPYNLQYLPGCAWKRNRVRGDANYNQIK